ncbi:MAG: hypothetical protein QY310_02155 [Candidatus Jettenia sp. CY-1]|nr:hypothetical protein [Candidatus Jettenia sp.]WKZ19375.1 MAG: hypothetical protein QY310_02155 [Candidatus Jettenia sp. CY-1]
MIVLPVILECLYRESIWRKKTGKASGFLLPFPRGQAAWELQEESSLGK